MSAVDATPPLSRDRTPQARYRHPSRRAAATALTLVAAVALLVPAPARAAAHAAWSGRARYLAVAPAVALDTATGTGTRRAPLAAGRAVSVTVAGRYAVPSRYAGAVEVEVEVTASVAKKAKKAAALAVYRTGAKAPTAGRVTLSPGSTTTTNLVVPLGTGGRIDVLPVGSAAQVKLRVLGWFDAGGYAPVTPTRIAATATGGGVRKGPITTDDSEVIVRVLGRAGVSAGAAQVAVLVTATGVKGSGALVVGPTGAEPTGRLAFRTSRSATALMVVAPGFDGSVSAAVTGGCAHLTMDVLGWVSQPVPTETGIRLVSIGVVGHGVDGYVGSRVDVSADGRYVGWWTNSYQAHPHATPGMFRTDMVTGTIVPVAAGEEADGVLSRDGSTAGYVTRAEGDGAGAYVRVLPGGVAKRVDVTLAGVPAPGAARVEALSGDGGLVLFSSDAGGLVAGTTGGVRRLYLRDLTAGKTSLVATCSSEGRLGCFAAMTPDAAWVVYVDGRSGQYQSYRWERATGEAKLVSASPGGAASKDGGWATSISDDGRLVAFESSAADLLAEPVTGSHVYVRDVAAGTTVLVDRTPTGAVANAEATGVYLSGDGKRVTIVSKASNLTSPGVTSRYGQIYVRELSTGATRLVTRTPYGTPGNGYWDTSSESGSWAPTLSPDGRWLAFASQSTDLVEGGTTGYDVFRADLGAAAS